MQYGNKSKNTVDEKEIIEFKSYYVVWKQKQTPYDDWGISKFKSYYVVWKHNKGISK